MIKRFLSGLRRHLPTGAPLSRGIIGVVLILALALLAIPCATSTTQAAPPAGMVQLIVKFKPNVNSAAMDAAINSNGGTTARNLPQLRTRVINVSAAAATQVVNALSKHASVERAGLAIKMKKAGAPNDPDFARQWALTKIA